jgi:hypothetical protein
MPATSVSNRSRMRSVTPARMILPDPDSEQPFPMSRLMEIEPVRQLWETQSSGRIIPPEAARRLGREFVRYVGRGAAADPAAPARPAPAPPLPCRAHGHGESRHALLRICGTCAERAHLELRFPLGLCPKSHPLPPRPLRHRPLRQTTSPYIPVGLCGASGETPDLRGRTTTRLWSGR